MNLLLDENLSPRLTELLSGAFTKVVHVRDVGLASADDTAVWEFAAGNDYVIVTKDADFNQRAFLLGAPPKVVWIRWGNASTSEIESLIRKHVDAIQEFASEVDASLLALTR